MMKFEAVKRATAVAMLAGVAVQAHALPIGLDFEGIADGAQVLEFYNGGTDSAGNPGTNFGVSFGSDALARIDADAGGNGNFANEPSPDTILFFDQNSAILNFAAGFDTGFSFFYSSSTAATVTVYPLINAGGTPLATLSLVANSIANGCTGDPEPDGNPEEIAFCNWDAIGEGFAGIARSIDFGGTGDRTGFDNVTFGAVNPVPLPAGVWLLGSGLLGLAALRRRRQSVGCAA